MTGRPPVRQPRSLTPAERQARATRPDLWPAFLAPPSRDDDLLDESCGDD